MHQRHKAERNLIHFEERHLNGLEDNEAQVVSSSVARGSVVTAGSGGLIVDFDGRQVALTGESLDVIEPAWAISIHKSQGSEYRAVVVVLHRAHRIMLRRNLLYTAMTRAREFCCVVADPWALQTAVRTAGGMARWTRLADRLRET